jgi:hypothetical protein
MGATRLGFDIIPDPFTNPWQVVLATKIFKDTGEKAVKSMWGAQGWNTDLMDRLVKLASDPIATGANRWTYMKANSGANEKIIQSFFNHIRDSDVIDTPSFLGEISQSIVDFLRGTSKLPGKVADSFTLLLIVAGLAAAGYVLFNVKKFTPAKKEIASPASLT